MSSYNQQIINAVDNLADRLIAVSRDIHAHPELNYEEHYAHDLLTRVLADYGLDVTPHAYGVDTAFEAVVGDPGAPEVLVLLEYDALPGIGHGCGHNVIAAAGLGAGLVAASLARDLGEASTNSWHPCRRRRRRKNCDGSQRSLFILVLQQ